jgi:DNA polymerase (family 10)
MSVLNAEIAGIFNRYAALLEIEGANSFRIRAYRNAARTVQDLPQSLESMLKEGEDLSELPTIGKDLAAKIKEIVETGQLSDLQKLEQKTPGDLAKLTALPGLGPKRVKALYDVLKIANLADLQTAIEAGKLRELPGFGSKTEEKILKEIKRHLQAEKRTNLHAAEQVAESLLRHLKGVVGVKAVVVAGSYRRRRETVGDLDILVTCTKGSNVMDRFIGYDAVEEVISKGKTRSTVLLRLGLQIDLRVVPQVSYGAALHYFTGSKAHNIAVRRIAVKRGLKLNEYGIFKREKRVAGRTEEEVFAQVDLPYIEPELRENRGEIEAARKGALPRLISLADIRGDLHSHTKATDGKYTIRKMAEAARERGYEYLAITDHTKHVTVAHGLDAKRLAKQIEDIDRLNKKLEGIMILKSAEVDILEDGSLDLPNEILKELDLTVCSVHYKFDLAAQKQTARIIRAMDNPYFNILGHPTGRLIGQRDPYAINMRRLMMAALERGCYFEVNAQPERLDLTDIHCRMAKEMGLRVAISTDAHTTATLDYMRFGVGQARRGWLEPEDVLNTRSWKNLKKLLKRR